MAEPSSPPLATFGVSLPYLLYFNEKYVRGADSHNAARLGARMSTAEVRRAIKELTSRDPDKSLAETLPSDDVWASKTGSWELAKKNGQHLFFICFSDYNPFELTINSLNLYFSKYCEEHRVRPRDIFVWLDFLAFPQNNAVVWGGVDWTHPLETSEGPGGPSIFEKTIVVLDKEASIMSRLWCVYEMAITGAGRLVLTSYDFTWQDAARVYRGFDIAAARCSYAQDADFIYAGIKERYGEIDPTGQRVHPVTQKLKLILAEIALDALMASPQGGARALAPAGAAGAPASTNAAVNGAGAESGPLPPVPPLSALSEPKKFHVFLSHDWGVEPHHNHAKVMRVKDALAKLGLSVWLDSEQMSRSGSGGLLHEMSKGIDESVVGVVFITENYISKIQGDNHADACKLEFNYMARMMQPGNRMVAVPAEPAMLVTANWRGAVGFVLGGKIYPATFTSAEDGEFQRGVERLYRAIVGIVSDNLAPQQEAAGAGGRQ